MRDSSHTSTSKPLARPASAAATANVSGYNLEKREEKTVGGKSAVVLTQSAVTPEGTPVAQRQAYLDIGADIVVVTCTAPKKDSAKASAAFDKLLTTLAVG